MPDSVTFPYGTGGGGGSDTIGLVPIDNQEVTSVASIEFAGDLSTTYDRYELDVTVITPATDNEKLLLQVSEDGGSTWETGASAYSWAYQGSSGGGATNSANANYDGFKVTDNVGIGNAAGEFGEMTITVSRPTDTTRETMFRAIGSFINSGGTLVTFRSSGYYKTSSVVDSVRLIFESGNIQDGDVTIYGKQVSV